MKKENKLLIALTSIFVGLIIGALPMLFRKVKGSKIDLRNIICFVITLQGIS